MQIELTKTEKDLLEKMHKSERNRRIGDRIKAVLLNSEGWSNSKIAQALRIHEETVSDYLSDFTKLGKLSINSGGSESKLNEFQTAELISYCTENTFVSTTQIQNHIFVEYGVEYGHAGIYEWLIKHSFSYKKPKEIPAKADANAQKQFLEYYKNIKQEAQINQEPILFIDSVHPTMATKVSYGWIKKGTEKIIKTTASRTRMNISGAIELNQMKIIHQDFETIDGEATKSFLAKVRGSYDLSKAIHIILDNSGYHKSGIVQNFSVENNIKLHFLPPYSPNLNPIERLWKLMNERTRNNYFFSSAKEFREKINGFFTDVIPEIEDVLRYRITDNFCVVGAVV